MQEILFGYKLNPTTWAYVSSLMILGIYFKFHRFWSVRNLDLVTLLCFSPGLLLIYLGLDPEPQKKDPAQVAQVAQLMRLGYVWLFATGGVVLVRLLLDPVMVRRPLLEPNLNASGLSFTGAALLVFLMANIVTSPKERLEFRLAAQAQHEAKTLTNPGFPPFERFANFPNQVMVAAASPEPETRHIMLLRAFETHAAAILAHLAVVAGMVWIGYRHFDNIHTGVAAATLYLLAFYTSQLTSQVDHVVPAMLLVWAVAAYRLPVLSGILLGFAGGLIYYPLFLLPLWGSFYWRRGAVRFFAGVFLALGLLVLALALVRATPADFVDQVRLMFGWRNPLDVKATGLWHFYDNVFRMPVMAAFFAICGGLALWPAQKNLGTLLSCSAAVMLATQFWHANQGGLSMAWYLPLLILTIFRPNLEDRIALSAVRPAWGRRRKG
jgi:hypothetical protein